MLLVLWAEGLVLLPVLLVLRDLRRARQNGGITIVELLRLTTSLRQYSCRKHFRIEHQPSCVHFMSWNGYWVVLLAKK